MYNAYILVPLAVWAIAQLTKFIVSAAEGKLDFKALYASGGMPSVHAAVTCSLATTALLVDGASSHLFGFTAVFAAIVMYDSLGVRRSSGEQGVALNMVIQSLTRNRVALVDPNVKLREVLGHKPSEVFVGAVVGIVLGVVLNLNHAMSVITFFSATPGRFEIYVYSVVGAVLILGALIARVLMGLRRSKILKTFANKLLYAGLASGVVITLLAFSEFEKAGYVSWRFWMVVALLGAAAYKLSILNWARKTVPAARALEDKSERMAKWLPTSKKKKAKKR